MPDGKLIEVISKQAVQDVEKLTQSLMQAFDVTVEWEKQLKTVNLPSQLKAQFNSVNNEVSKIKKTTSDYEKTQRKLHNTEKRRFEAMTKTGKQIQKNRLETNRLNRVTRLEAKLQSELSGEYEKLDAALSKLKLQYRDLAVRKEL